MASILPGYTVDLAGSKLSQPPGNLAMRSSYWAAWSESGVNGTHAGSRPRGPVPGVVPGAPNIHIADIRIIHADSETITTRYAWRAPRLDHRSV